MVLNAMLGLTPQPWEMPPDEAELDTTSVCVAGMEGEDFDEDFDDDFDDEDFDDDFDDDFEQDFDDDIDDDLEDDLDEDDDDFDGLDDDDGL